MFKVLDSFGWFSALKSSKIRLNFDSETLIRKSILQNKISKLKSQKVKEKSKKSHRTTTHRQVRLSRLVATEVDYASA